MIMNNNLMCTAHPEGNQITHIRVNLAYGQITTNFYLLIQYMLNVHGKNQCGIDFGVDSVYISITDLLLFLTEPLLPIS